jgi:RHS repeat-associated protein
LASRSDIFEGSTDSFVHDPLNGIPDPEALAPILNLNSTVRYNAGGAGRTVAYTASNMTASISEGTANLALSYDPEHARVLQSATIAGAVSTTTYLNDPASNVLTETVHITGKNTWKTYIVADGKIVGLRTTVNGQPAIDMKYFIHDHLGSIAVVTDGNKYLADGITLNPAYATAIERDAYDAWGKARVAATGADDTSCLLPGQSVTTRGFTGQEEMPSVCLVNYNARIYDPALGKFMTPDDMIPDAYRGQDYNRYTYVGDNPLSYEDPTGHLTCTNCTGLSQMSTSQFDSSDAPSEESSSNQQAAGNPDPISHANPAIAASGPSSSGITNAGTTIPLGGANQITIPAGQTPDANGLFHGTLTYDKNSDLGKAIEAGNADVGSFKFDMKSGSLGFVSSSSGADDPGNQQKLRYSVVLDKIGVDGFFEKRIKFGLTKPSQNGGYIIQEIIDNVVHRDGNGNIIDQLTYHYWEAWQVPAGSTQTTLSKYNSYDDKWLDAGYVGHGSVAVSGSARFYENTSLPSSFVADNPKTNAGILPSTTINPNLPTSRATAPVDRNYSERW